VVSRIYELYELKLEENNAMDFDDLLMKTTELFSFNDEILRFYQDKFKYILVDEYQDTNHSQYILVKLLAQKHQNLCVVGDPDQSIYRWRGADINNILSFERDYPQAKVVKLERNYRSTACILEAANAVIEHNCSRKEKNLWTERPQGDKISLVMGSDDQEEAALLISEMLSLKADEGYSFGDMAVLYRTHSQSRSIEEELVRASINYQIFGGTKFYERKEIKDVLAYLKVIANNDDNVSLARIVNVPKRGIGTTSWSRVLDFAAENAVSTYGALGRAEEIITLSSRAKKQLAQFKQLMDSFKEKASNSLLKDLVSEILDETGYLDALIQDTSIEAETRRDNLREFLNVATRFNKNNPQGTLEDFLAEISLVTDIDQYIEDVDKLTLMTLHSAKGLEFPIVFMIGLEEGIFPHARSLESEVELEEERRLCYVGMTRGQDRLYLSFAQKRFLHGENRYNPPSRFLEEIPNALLDQPFEKAPSLKDVFGSELAQESSEAMYNLGDRVYHKKWGQGVVIEAKLGDTVIKVAFPELGIKSLDTDFAPLENLSKR
jgi:DNA helicase-2/ATP-dependent DNA helicase PcrA